MENEKEIIQTNESIATTQDIETKDAQTSEKTAKTKKKRKWPWVLLIVFIVLLTPVVVAFIILYGRIATMASVEHVDQDFYKMTYKADYHLDKLLEADISTEEDLFQFISDEIYFGYPIASDNISKYACSAFLAKTPDGTYAAGRNFDYFPTNELLVYTDPSDGYASYSMVDLDILGVDEENGMHPDSLMGRAAMLAAPYACTDGMNEKGLMVTILNLYPGEILQRTDRPDILIVTAVRLLLDRAANVDEAIDLLRQYDIHTTTGMEQHLFIADSTGRSVVVEWPDAKFKVIEYPCVTNFWLSFILDKDRYIGQCNRFDAMVEWLNSHPTTTYEQAMQLLDRVKLNEPDYITEWSCVYHLNDFTMDIAVNIQYDKVYHFTREDF